MENAKDTSKSLFPVGHADKKTDIAIAKKNNEIYKSNFGVKTVSMMVKEDYIGVSSKSKRPDSIIPTWIRNVIKSMFDLYVQLEHAHCSKQSKLKACR